MSSGFKFPESRKTLIVQTGMMKLALNRTMRVHQDGSLSAWSGRAGIGKTTTAEYIVKIVNENYDPDNPCAFKAVHYEAGAVAEWSKHEMKRGIRSLYCGVDCRMDEGIYKSYLPEELAADLVHYLKKMNIQLIFVDEAGCLSVNAIRGLVLVSDTARIMQWNMTIVLIGMDDLPVKLTKLPQVERRVTDWCYFKPYALKDTHKLLAALHPHFTQLDLTNIKHREQVEYIHDAYQGLPGSIVPFAHRFSSMYAEVPEEDPMVHIQASHLQPLLDKQRAINDYNGEYKRSIKELDNETSPMSNQAA
jgi:hypothetical protein